MALVPFYFGPSEHPLFGVHHPAKEQSRHGVLLCYPVGHEYQRVHRLFCQLGNRLAAAGLPVMRFDYSCTGDSSGATNEGTWNEWLADVRTAADELREVEQLTTLSAVGLRLGASLAACAGVERDFETLVLWDPVVNGREYLAAMHALHVAVLQTNDPTWAWTSDVERDTELLGYLMPDRLRTELEGIDLLTLPRFPARRVVVVESDTRECYSALCRRLAEQGQDHEEVRLDGSADWEDQFRFGTVVSAPRVIDEIVSALTVARA